MTESTGKMRDWIIALTEHDFNWKRVQGLDILDEIEREIAELYMELPLDADGSPIRVGDEMESDNETFVVCAVAPGRVHRWDVHNIGELDKGTVAYPPASLRHFKPRTVEDATRDFVNSVVTFKGSRDGIPIVGIDDSLWRDYFDAFADEIRELLEVEK